MVITTSAQVQQNKTYIFTILFIWSAYYSLQVQFHIKLVLQNNTSQNVNVLAWEGRGVGKGRERRAPLCGKGREF
jgi:hypothetical protein